MEDTLASLRAPLRKLKRSTQYHFVLYDGDPRNKGYQGPPKPHSPWAFEKLVNAAVVNHNKEMDILKSLIDYWQAVCGRLEKKKVKGIVNFETSSPTVSPPLATPEANTIGNTHSSTQASISSTVMQIDDQGAMQTDAEIELPELEASFLEVMWDYFENGAILMWPGFRVTRKPSIKVRHHAWKLANGVCANLGANQSTGCPEQVVAGGVDQLASMEQGEEYLSARRQEVERTRDSLEGAVPVSGTANYGGDKEIGTMASVHDEELQPEEKVLELVAEPEEGQEPAVEQAFWGGGCSGTTSEMKTPCPARMENACHESTQCIQDDLASPCAPYVRSCSVQTPSRPETQCQPTETLTGELHDETPTDLHAWSPLLSHQPVSILLSLAENLVCTTLGCIFWQEQRTLGPALASHAPGHGFGNFRGLSSPCALAALSPQETDIRHIFDAFAAHQIAQASHLLHLLLIQIKRCYENANNAPIHDNLQRNPVLYTRFMHLVLSYATLCHKTQRHVRTRLWIDFASWLAKNGSFAAHLPFFNTTSQRITLFLLRLGTHGHLEWLQLFETVQMLNNSPTTSPYNWIDDGLSEFYTWSMEKSFNIGKTEMGEQEFAKMLNWLNEQHLGWTWKNWQTMKGWVDWIWIQESDTLKEEHQKRRLQQKKLGLAIQPRNSISKPEYEVPHDIWPKFSLPEGLENDEPDSTDSSETLEVEKDETPKPEPFLPPWLNVTLVSAIMTLISAAVDKNYAGVGLCLAEDPRNTHQSGIIFIHHHWFGAGTQFHLRRQIAQIRKSWAALLRICGRWISDRASEALEDEIVILRLQYHLVASQLTGLVHKGAKLHLSACMDLLKPYRAEHRAALMVSVRDKVCGAEASLEGCPYERLVNLVEQLRAEEAAQVSSATYPSGYAEWNAVRSFAMKFSKSNTNSNAVANVVPLVDFDIAMFDTQETSGLFSDDLLGETNPSFDFTSLFDSDDSSGLGSGTALGTWRDSKYDNDTPEMPHEANRDESLFAAPYGYPSQAMDISPELNVFDGSYSESPHEEPIAGNLVQLTPGFQNKFGDSAGFAFPALSDTSHETQESEDAIAKKKANKTQRKKRSTPNGTPLVNRRKRLTTGPSTTSTAKRSIRKPKQVSV